jgi:glucose-6-phosphate isomerase
VISTWEATMECRVGAQLPKQVLEEAARRLADVPFSWLRAAGEVRAQLDQIQEFSTDVRDAGFSHVVLLGMGGAVLPAEVITFALAPRAGSPELVILDTTDPGAIAAAEARVNLPRTLFVVADKPGETIETSALHAYFLDKVRTLRGDEAGRQFVAVTDEGSALEWRVHQEGMSALFLNDDEVPFGFSALSYFGVVPASLAGVDVGRLLERAQVATAAWRPDGGGGAADGAGGGATGGPGAASGIGGESAGSGNPAVELGAAMAWLARQGRDKLTIVCSPGVGNFGSWIEGLMAGSTGKDGTGVVPVDVEPLQPAEGYGGDRQFVYLRLEDEPDAGQDEALERLEEAGLPVHRLSLRDRYDIGAAFVLWEIAAVTAAAQLGVDPFEQPELAAGEDEELQALVDLEESGTALEGEEDADASLAADGVPIGPALRDLVADLTPPDYVALQAWVTPGNEAWLELQAMREALVRRRGVATSEGFAPRLLPVTGQLHKGGPATCVSLQLVSGGGPELQVPGQAYTFGRLKRAQSLGDLQALSDRGRRVLRVDLGDDHVAGLRAFRELLERVLAEGDMRRPRAA